MKKPLTFLLALCAISVAMLSIKVPKGSLTPRSVNEMSFDIWSERGSPVADLLALDEYLNEQ